MRNRDVRPTERHDAEPSGQSHDVLTFAPFVGAAGDGGEALDPAGHGAEGLRRTHSAPGDGCGCVEEDGSGHGERVNGNSGGSGLAGEAGQLRGVGAVAGRSGALRTRLPGSAKVCSLRSEPPRWIRRDPSDRAPVPDAGHVGGITRDGRFPPRGSCSGLRERGSAATTNDIAARVGVSLGTPSQYCDGNDALLVALADRHLPEVREQLGAALVGVAPEVDREALSRTTIATVVEVNRPRALHRVVFSIAPRTPDLVAVLDRLRDDRADAIANLPFADGLEPADAHRRSQLLVVAIDACIHEHVLVADGDQDHRVRMQHLVAMALATFAVYGAPWRCPGRHRVPRSMLGPLAVPFGVGGRSPSDARVVVPGMRRRSALVPRAR